MVIHYEGQSWKKEQEDVGGKYKGATFLVEFNICLKGYYWASELQKKKPMLPIGTFNPVKI